VFNFIKYIQPLWYYRLASRMPHAVLLDKEELDKLVEAGSIFRGNYIEGESVYLDLAYQALQMGYIPNQSDKPNFQNSVVDGVADNYRFIFRHFGKAKALYVLFWRIISFENPIREIYSFLKNRESKVLLKFIESEQNRFLRQTITEPRVSVIIPTLNRYEYLKDVLSDLEKQTYKNFDVWICDQSDKFNEEFYKGWSLDLNVIKQEEKALWRARNKCVKDCNSDWVLFSEDDVRINSEWLTNHMKVFDSTNAKVVCGVFHKDENLPQELKKLRIATFFASGNGLVHKSVFDKCGLFDEKFEKMRMGDGEFGLRCALNGVLMVQNPYSPCIDIKAPTGGLRQMGAWDAIHSIGLFKPRPIPSSLYLARKHFDNETALIYGLSQLPKSLIPYRLKGSGALKKIPYLFGSILLSPILLLTFWMSWKKSTEMLER
jgi:glycosyltransferase involved in cell wall biosynthesis